jgi:hypothetical protein
MWGRGTKNFGIQVEKTEVGARMQRHKAIITRINKVTCMRADVGALYSSLCSLLLRLPHASPVLPHMVKNDFKAQP